VKLLTVFSNIIGSTIFLIYNYISSLKMYFFLNISVDIGKCIVLEIYCISKTLIISTLELAEVYLTLGAPM